MLFSRKPKEYFLSLIAIFKNESSGIVEWIEHYLSQGVDHFLMINNGSSDDGVNKITKYIENGLITLINDSTRHAQVHLYNKYFLKNKHISEWLIICDLDEFIYARNGFSTIKEYLRSRAMETAMIRIPWKMFGSSGKTKQPESIIHSFTKRSICDGSEKPWINKPGYEHSKVIVRSKSLYKLHIHHARIRWMYTVEDANGRQTDLKDVNFQTISESDLKEAFLHLNHYPLQSKEWFMKVKCTRGDINSEGQENVRNLQYFQLYDEVSNELEDTELVQLQR